MPSRIHRWAWRPSSTSNFATWTDSGGEPERVLARDEMLDDITFYWLTNTGASSSRSYWEAARHRGGPFNAVDIPTVPVAVTVFPGEISPAPRGWGEQCFHNLIYWNEVDKGGHFAAWEQPALFATEVRAAFRSLRPSADDGAGAAPRACRRRGSPPSRKVPTTAVMAANQRTE
jgi:pimeloyl-ACP methyl ester carboxylesterase